MTPWPSLHTRNAHATLPDRTEESADSGSSPVLMRTVVLLSRYLQRCSTISSHTRQDDIDDPWGSRDDLHGVGWKTSVGPHRRSVLAPAGLVIRDVWPGWEVPEDMRRRCERSAREVREEGGSERRSEATFVHYLLLFFSNVGWGERDCCAVCQSCQVIVGHTQRTDKRQAEHTIRARPASLRNACAERLLGQDPWQQSLLLGRPTRHIMHG